MPPTISEAVTKGPLGEAEKKILAVIENHTSHVWSTTLEDLKELALWATSPTSVGAPDQTPEATGAALKMNDKFMAKVNREERPTYTLRTVATCLATLAKGKRIWSDKLYGRLYYGHHDAEETIRKEIDKLPEDQRTAADFRSSD